jgi:hypothetical protein
LDTNQFEVKNVRSLGLHGTEATGHVTSGELTTGAWVSFSSPKDIPVTAQIRRIGTADAPLNRARGHEVITLLLEVSADQVAEGTTLETCEDEVSAPALLLTQMGSDARADLPVPPEELVSIERAIDAGKYAESMRELEEMPTDPKTYHIVKRLMAKICLNADDELRDPEQALDLILEAYSMRGSADPDVNETLAQALGENGDPAGGLRYLDRLYMSALDQDAGRYYENLIQQYRKRFNIPDQWDVLDPLGDVILTAHEKSAVADGYLEHAFPAGSQVRTNRVGKLVPVEEFTANVEPTPDVVLEPADGAAPAKPSRRTLVIAGIGAALGAFLGMNVAMMAGQSMLAMSVAGAAGGAVVGMLLARTL